MSRLGKRAVARVSSYALSTIIRVLSGVLITRRSPIPIIIGHLSPISLQFYAGPVRGTRIRLITQGRLDWNSRPQGGASHAADHCGPKRRRRTTTTWGERVSWA